MIGTGTGACELSQIASPPCLPFRLSGTSASVSPVVSSTKMARAALGVGSSAAIGSSLFELCRRNAWMRACAL